MNDAQQQFISLAGTFRARAKEWALGLSSTGKEQIAVMFELVDGPHQGKHITWFGYFTDTTVDRTLEALRHCGWASDSLADLDTLASNEVELVIKDEHYEGKWRSKVQWVNRPSRLQMREQMSPSQVQAFAARLRGKAIASKQQYQPGPSAPSTRALAGPAPRPALRSEPEVQYPDEDQIPF